MKATCTNSTFDCQREKEIHHYTHFIHFSLCHRCVSGVEQAGDCYPEWERSAHIAVGQVIVTTCTVSTLSHSGTVNGGSKIYAGLMSLRSRATRRELVLTRAVDRRRMDRRVRAEVKVVSLLTLASFLISTYAAVM